MVFQTAGKPQFSKKCWKVQFFGGVSQASSVVLFPYNPTVNG